MLLSFSFSNFYSFVEKTHVSMQLTSKDTVLGWDRLSPSGRRATTAMAVVGANGAGKTSLIRAGAFLSHFIERSFSGEPDADIPLIQHTRGGGTPSNFEVEMDDLSGTRWTYRLSAVPRRVLHESLHVKHRDAKRTTPVFTREWDTKTEAYQIQNLTLGIPTTEALKVRQNVSLISWARQYGVSIEADFGSMKVLTNVGRFGRPINSDAQLTIAARRFSKQAQLAQRMRDLLTSWDLGLSSVRLRKFEEPHPGAAQAVEQWFPFGVHSHAGESFELPFSLESSGTQSAFIMLMHLLATLDVGGVAFIDELECDMHPHMMEPMLRLFDSEESNPLGAQLVFSTQSSEVLKVLQRQQVTFVEKVDCESSAWRGDDIQGLTSQHNLYGKYMAGALGAVPQF